MARSGEAPPPAPLDRPAAAIAIIISGFHRDIAERLLRGAESRLREVGHTGEVEIRWVPGAFERPLGAKTLAGAGRFSAVIALGAVIRGETSHFDVICDACASGLSRVALDTGVPCAFGVLTCDTVDQALARSGGPVGNAGEAAVDAAVALANLIAEPPR
jgi:6,7-dimethyl-8-ribityllumazine synthase